MLELGERGFWGVCYGQPWNHAARKSKKPRVLGMRSSEDSPVVSHTLGAESKKPRALALGSVAFHMWLS
jgi:hypothetical protein